MTRRIFIILFLLPLTILCQNKLSREDSITQRNAEDLAKKVAEENAKRQAMGLEPNYSKDTTFYLSNGKAISIVSEKPVKTYPEYPGGNNELKKFITTNLKKPKDAITGKVYMRFTVNESGQVTNPKVLKGLNSSCDKAAIDVINKLPKFKPAVDKQNKPTSYDFNIPIEFN